MSEFFELKVAGLTRQLPICKVNDHLSIAAFIMFSDIEMTVAAATELLRRVPEYDVLLTAESKGIPLAYEMSRQSGKKYILARKSVKLYMRDPVEVDVKSITTANPQKLYLDAEDLHYLKNKRVLVVDDVISTGRSLQSLESLVEKAGGIIAGKAAVLAEGEASEREDIIYLAPLPVFPKE
ncbi:MAG: adenine phosphoribosyltransferase [Provencibacterium sp.]|jgi:adenine phosphoribosyltransferase|nr:adenine phosphoribosyltransferase [Provencibacterium sp.]